VSGPVFKYQGGVLPSEFGVILPPDDEWLSRQPAEDVVLPSLPVVDTHHHLWDHPGLRYLPPELAADLNTGHNVIGTIHLDCEMAYRTHGPEQFKPVGETEFVGGEHMQSQSGLYGSADIAGVSVGYADLSLGATVREVLDAHVSARLGRFKDVRLQSCWDPSNAIRNGQAGDRPRVLLDAAVRFGLAVIDDMSLTFDSYLLLTQPDELARPADAPPGLTIVMDHCGGPLADGPYAEHRSEHYATWLRGIQDVAKRPDVTGTLGGILNRTDIFDYLNADQAPSSEQPAYLWRQWIEPCIEAFGAGVCMFESNYPLENVDVGSTTLWNTFERLAADATDDERSALFSGTATRVYTIDVLTHPLLPTSPPTSSTIGELL